MGWVLTSATPKIEKQHVFHSNGFSENAHQEAKDLFKKHKNLETALIVYKSDYVYKVDRNEMNNPNLATKAKKVPTLDLTTLNDKYFSLYNN